MAFLNVMNISASGMTAQRMRMDVASENIASQDITRTEGGGPYQRKMVVFESIGDNNFRNVLKNTALSSNPVKGGVRVSAIIEDDRSPKMVYNPNHPDANENGYVEYPNVDILKETVDFMAASRSYDANITAFNAIKAMATKALEIGK